MVLPAFCYKCKRRIQSLFLVGVCVECYADMTDDEKEDAPQRIWETLHSKEFLVRWPTPLAFDEAHQVITREDV